MPALRKIAQRYSFYFNYANIWAKKFHLQAELIKIKVFSKKKRKYLHG